MKTATRRLRLSEEILTQIEQKRAESGDEGVGASIERAIINLHLMELEWDILENPGALQPYLR
jgi:hypothetical protein